MATTGLEDEQKQTLHAASARIPIVWAPSMSLAVNLTMKLATIAANALKSASSSVDVETELKIQEALHEWMSGRTTLIIAQRISTVLKADKIVVLEKGRIAGSGSHRQLLDVVRVRAAAHNDSSVNYLDTQVLDAITMIASVYSRGRVR